MTSSPDASLTQQQFLTVLTKDEAMARFSEALRPRPLGIEEVDLLGSLGRVLAERIRSTGDAPPFDRSGVDGFALRAADLAEASGQNPVALTVNAEILACGTVPAIAVQPGTTTPIATGAPVPRGADCVVMIEQTEHSADGMILMRKPAMPGQNIAFAGSDIARGQTMLEAGLVIGAREIAMLAAIGRARVPVWRKPIVGVISTGDELVSPVEDLRPAGIHDSNGPTILATLMEEGCTPRFFGIVPDEPLALAAALRDAHAACDAVILSGGTSKGAGDLTYRLIGELGAPGIIAHGVALKPGKPLCLAVCDGKAVIGLPGFPTSAMFTLHEIVIPFFRQLAGLPPRMARQVEARLPVRVGSELGRTEFVMVALAETEDGLVAHPLARGSGAVTAFAQADGYFSIDAQADYLPAGETLSVQLLSRQVEPPHLTIMGSHCSGLDEVVSLLSAEDIRVRIVAVGSLGGLSALRRGECDIAPIHLLDPVTGLYNQPLLDPHLDLVPGWERMQGIVFRPDDARFAGLGLEAVRAQLLADASLMMVNRNAGSGTRVLIDQLLAGARPPGYSNQPRAHHAVAASVAQGRADWGLAIEPVARAFGLGFLPLSAEEYDFAVARNPRNPGMIARFRAALVKAGPAIAALGFRPKG